MDLLIAQRRQQGGRGGRDVQGHGVGAAGEMGTGSSRGTAHCDATSQAKQAPGQDQWVLKSVGIDQKNIEIGLLGLSFSASC